MEMNERASRARAGLTRISVMGTHNGFLVRMGDEHARAVRRVGGRLVCECGAPNCAHVEAVVLCGFAEGLAGQQMAA
jgi:hypothetical protein